MKDLDELSWYIIPYNWNDVRIVGVDKNDTTKVWEDGGEFKITIPRLHFVLLDLSSTLQTKSVFPIEERVYESYLETDRQHEYSWNEIKKIALNILFEWYKSNGRYNVRKYYKVKS